MNTDEKLDFGQKIRKQMSDLHLEFKIFTEEYKRQIKLVQEKCTHKWTYHSDPSGGNDSGHSCDYCGLWK